MAFNNNVVLVGNLTADPSVSDGDSPVVNFRIAVNQRFKKPGEEEFSERTDFVDVECWGRQATNVAASLHKGDRAIVAGQLKHEQWQDAEGRPRNRMKVKAHVIGPSLEFDGITV